MFAPRLDRAAGIVQICEPVKVQARVAEAAVEAFDERVPRRFAWLDEVELDAPLPCSEEHRLTVIDVSTSWPTQVLE